MVARILGMFCSNCDGLGFCLSLGVFINWGIIAWDRAKNNREKQTAMIWALWEKSRL